jgi:hypothetical protein
MCNLRQLMQLQDERIANEERAVRERRAAEARALAQVAEQQRAAEAELALQVREAAERVETERQTALLRVQLQAAASQRAGDGQLQQAQRARDGQLQQAQRELAGVLSQSEMLTARLRRRSALWAVVGATLAGAAVWWMAQTQAAEGSRQAAALSGLQAREVGELRARLSQLTQLTAAVREPAPSVQPLAVVSSSRKPLLKTQPQRLKRHKQPATEESSLQLLDLGEDDADPLLGLPPTR